jgi:iron complex outermembrane receptor protein
MPAPKRRIRPVSPGQTGQEVLMKFFRPAGTGLVIAVGLFCANQTLALAQTQSQTPPQPQAQAQTQGQKPPTPTPTPTPTPDPQKPVVVEKVVVSASKNEQQLVDAPATMTVIGPKALEVAPSGNYAELLRAVPGVNITQISARDVNVTTRGATSSLATAQLTVVDGRSVYLDFFGFTMWEFVPTDLNEIKRIEVIRGPASAVWGANALNGVVNVITKTPREMAGQYVTFGGGMFNREVNDDGADSGAMFYVRGTHAQVVNDRWSYKIGAGFYDSDALARPTGTIPNGTGTPYPNFTNAGTRQPKFDARVDYEFADGISALEFSGGIGGTSGMMHTGIGPFSIEQGAQMGYWKTAYTRRAFRLQAFMNFLDGSATNVVSTDTSGKPIDLTFAPKTVDVEVGDTQVVGGRHVLTYGGNIRYNRFELSIAPGETSRTEGGAYLQDDFIISDQWRLTVGARVDKFSSIENAVFSPRAALLFKPDNDQSIRLSYNRAFRSPSMVNNNLDTVIGTALPLGLIHPIFGSTIYYVPTTAVGNPNLTEESVDAYELAYTAFIGERTAVSAAVFYTRYKDGIYFTETAEWLTAPPLFPGIPGFLTPDQVWGLLLAQGYSFPSNYTYENLGTVKNKGFELGINQAFTNAWSAFVNYTFQSEPIPSFPNMSTADALKEINLPSRHQVNAGVTYDDGGRFFGTLAVTHATEAFWQDVLDDRYHGFTEPFTSVNASFGVRFNNGRYTLAVRGTNLGNQEIQQHIFGDVLKRSVVAEFKIAIK